MKIRITPPALLLALAIVTTSAADAQRKKITKEQFTPAATKKVVFVPYKITDFATDAKSGNKLITLPNKKKVKLTEYVNALNLIEGNLSDIGFAKTRKEKTIVASKFRKADFSRPGLTTLLPAASAKPANTVIQTKFVSTKLQNKIILQERLKDALRERRESEINALPNQPFDRTHHLTPAPFRNGDYSATLDLTYYLKGVVDPFFVRKNQMRNDSLAKIIRETNSEFTAGMNITVMADVPEVGNITAYKLEAEYTSRSNKSKKHSSKSKLTVMQQVIINESNPNRNGDASSYRENRLHNLTKLIGAADVFTYGLNLLMPVDFYMNASSIGANIDVDMNRTGVSGSIGPRAAQSIFLETSYTELVGPFGEGISNVVDVGVGGELRLLEGGFDYGFSAGLAVNSNKIVFINDMQGEVDLELLRGRLFTFYQYPVFTCKSIFNAADIECWEMRRVENDLFNTGAALKYERTVVNEDMSAPVNW